ncbi:MAG: DUF2252 family protein [Candidatus Saccharibacteria bacterium]|nr:DUF2252 family protein [Moraxellaceae bacterium]
MSSRNIIQQPVDRKKSLTQRRNLKMARSVHAYVRGNTAKFYEWLIEADVSTIPQGPAIWICGDCHTGNLGPIANADGKVEIGIRDLDQTVIGNPAHDLIRLSLSLATAARGSDLPGVITAKMIEAVYEGYIAALQNKKSPKKPDLIRIVIRNSISRTWQHLAEERLNDIKPIIPLGKRFWPLDKIEQQAIHHLFDDPAIIELATKLRWRSNKGQVEVLDAAYWVKGCSSLGRLRYAVLLDIDDQVSDGEDLCLIDIKEGTAALAPRYADSVMPQDNSKRVVEGARHLSPSLGDRMYATRLLDRGVILRELLPQDLKLEVDDIEEIEAIQVARYLAFVVGKAHARQMDEVTCRSWLSELKRNQNKTIAAPLWLWRSVVELVSSHEAGYLEHCRQYALERE